MGLLKKPDHVASLGEWSDNVLDTFQNTIDNLHNLNGEIDSHHESLSSQKSKIEKDMEKLQNMKARHIRVMDKIQAIMD